MGNRNDKKFEEEKLKNMEYNENEQVTLKDRLLMTKYVYAIDLYNIEEYQKALDIFCEIEEYQDSK